MAPVVFSQLHTYVFKPIRICKQCFIPWSELVGRFYCRGTTVCYRKGNKRTLLLNFQDATVTELAQELAKKLGLKGRKAYVSPQAESAGAEGESLGETSSPTGDVGGACRMFTFMFGGLV